MNRTPEQRRWQISLAGLFLVVNLAAVVCAIAGYVGYAAAIGSFLVQGILLIVAIVSDRASSGGRRLHPPNRPRVE